MIFQNIFIVKLEGEGKRNEREELKKKKKRLKCTTVEIDNKINLHPHVGALYTTFFLDI
jgi:uncharacterized Zn-finger protein